MIKYERRLKPNDTDGSFARDTKNAAYGKTLPHNHKLGAFSVQLKFEVNMRTFSSSEVPVAYSMIAANQMTDSVQAEEHPFFQFFCYWTAFNNIYTTIAGMNSDKNSYKTRDDGTFDTSLNGSVRIRKVNILIKERRRIDLAFAQFSDSLQHDLITHPSSKFFCRAYSPLARTAN